MASKMTNKTELMIWTNMQQELRDHRSYFVRKKFYPHNMDEWQKEHSEIEGKYRKELLSLKREQDKNKKIEKEEQKKQQEQQEQRDINDAADALLMLRKSKRIQKKKNIKNEVVTLRRSTRIASQKK